MADEQRRSVSRLEAILEAIYERAEQAVKVSRPAAVGAARLFQALEEIRDLALLEMRFDLTQ
jgi:hypothetical protein